MTPICIKMTKRNEIQWDNEYPAFYTSVFDDLPYIRIVSILMLPDLLLWQFHRNRTWLLWGDSRFVLVFHKLSSCDILDRNSDSSQFFLRLDPPVCEEIAKTTWGFRFGRNRRLSCCPIRFYSLLPHVDEHKLART